jgi:non-canonical poly(A) RNA polymerase PAPD5/7
MLCLRDPADETNDLGRKAIAIKHVQATFKRLSNDLFRNMAQNTRYSLLGPLVGSSYMLNKERRENVRSYGAQLSKELKSSLAAKARMVKERERENKESPAEWAQARIARRARESEWRRVSEERNKKLRAEAGRTAILEHGDAISSILGMPSVEGDEQSEKSPMAYTSVDRASPDGSTTDRGPIKYSPSEEGKSGLGAASTTQDAQKIPSEKSW